MYSHGRTESRLTKVEAILYSGDSELVFSPAADDVKMVFFFFGGRIYNIACFEQLKELYFLQSNTVRSRLENFVSLQFH